MKISKPVIIVIFTAISAISFYSCDDTASLKEEPFTAPSRDLSAKEIMKTQGITSIHYIDYDSSIVNDESGGSSIASFEYYIDTCHFKGIQYLPEGWDSNIAVYDLKKNIAWNFTNGKLSYDETPSCQYYYNLGVKNSLGSRLEKPAYFSGVEVINGNYCNIFKDSNGFTEWIWTKYNLPIQQRRESHNSIFKQITFVQKRIVEINLSFPDTVFEP